MAIAAFANGMTNLSIVTLHDGEESLHLAMLLCQLMMAPAKRLLVLGLQ